MIKVLLLDIDGVMTDGTVLIDENGCESKKINFQDINAIFEAKRKGLSIGFVSGEDSSITEYFQKRFEPHYFIKGCKDKKKAIELLINESGISPENIAFVGDSKYDHEAIKMVGYGMCPANATDQIKEIADHILTRRGGNGAVNEAVLCLEMYNKKAGQRLKKTSEMSISHENFDLIGEILKQHHQMVQAIILNKDLQIELAKASQAIIRAFRNGNQVLFCGNGGSAADAQHLATEFVSRFYHERQALSAEALTTNTSSLTAIANDYDFERVFARQIEARGKAGDVLVGLTTSGQSANVIQALRTAKACGLVTVAMIGNRKSIELEEFSDIIIKIPAQLTPRIQEGHILAGHLICELVENEFVYKEN